MEKKYYGKINVQQLIEQNEVKSEFDGYKSSIKLSSGVKNVLDKLDEIDGSYEDKINKVNNKSCGRFLNLATSL